MYDLPEMFVGKVWRVCINFAARNALSLTPIFSVSLLLAACDVRTQPMANGEIPYAPFKNGWSDEPTVTLYCPIVIGCPAHGIVWSAASFGSSTSIYFDTDKNTLARISAGQPWGVPKSKKPGPAVVPQIVTVTPEERNELLKLANLAWAPRGPVAPSRPTMDIFSDVTLIDGKFAKQLNGSGAGKDLGAVLSMIAHRHGI
jgi:hypothetical protein